MSQFGGKKEREVVSRMRILGERGVLSLAAAGTFTPKHSIRQCPISECFQEASGQQDAWDPHENLTLEPWGLGPDSSQQDGGSAHMIVIARKFKCIHFMHCRALMISIGAHMPSHSANSSFTLSLSSGFRIAFPAAVVIPFQHTTLLSELTFMISGANQLMDLVLLYMLHVNFSKTKVDCKKLFKWPMKYRSFQWPIVMVFKWLQQLMYIYTEERLYADMKIL